MASEVKSSKLLHCRNDWDIFHDCSVIFLMCQTWIFFNSEQYSFKEHKKKINNPKVL